MGSQRNCIWFIVVLSYTLIASTHSAVFIPILQQSHDFNPVDGSYKFSYGTANGILASEQGRLQRLGPENVAKTVDGSYSYLNSDGTLVNVKYVADERGYHAVPSIVYRPQAVPRVASPNVGVYFQNYDTLSQALRL